MDIVFPRTDLHFHPEEAVLFIAELDGRRIDVRIEWCTLEALSGAAGAEAVSEFVKRERGGIERAIKAHIAARGVPPSRLITLAADELDTLKPPG